MCGLVGFVALKNEYNVENLNKMLSLIKHRGPDFQNTYNEKNVFLGHARLSILDLSHLGNQPMKYKGYNIIFNGEIYNYLEIRNQLVEKGHRFNSNTDTEVILHAYEEWGRKCLSFFRGMWSFVIYDSEKNEIFGSRDRFGIKPFYFINNNNIFAFSSEIKPLLSLPKIKSNVNFSTLSSYLMINIINSDNETFFGDIYQLEPGNYFIYDLNSKTMDIIKYYDLLKESNKHDRVSYEEFQDTLDRSFQLHVRSDVPIGTCLSGGLDSSIVTASSTKLVNKYPIRAVTAQSESSKNDESQFAKMVVDYLGIEGNKIKPTYKNFEEDIEKCLYIQEEPVGGPSVFMQYSVMQKAKDLNLKVMLDGQGGDEAFLGYERYYAFYLSGLIKKGHVLRSLKEYSLMTRNSKLDSIALLKYYLYFNNLNVRKKHLSSRHTDLRQEYVVKGLNKLDDLGYSSNNLESMQITELTKTNLPNLLKNEDRNSMAASIEARVPFVDHKLIELALKLPTESKIQNGYTKYSLRKYIDRKLPDDIVWRKNKIGFEAPSDLWLKAHSKIIEDEINNSKVLKEMYSTLPNLETLSLKELWKLYNISIWEKQYIR
ncbi:asparagine synthase (glutamine-hydrolyzing) [Domibacillus epiphyticus]|uniref:asparagine synthase (glutamine-hydrolyzing) n=1 Tax=Domibacillus epiphyticus TaxID=1714355 RepID=A0A1V2A6T3_9BACI|nr:asparagine synthase (glutamine-hydrolyzing) [Domibacillus epiphyticus]OMP66630.1 asparagine synthase (glutamine-hydrolyzing) [Domibacillus epiphyticus]